MGWIQAALIWVGTFVVGRLLRRRPKVEKPVPGTFSAEEMPVVSEATAIPVVWGTVRLDSVNVLWYGNTATREVRDGNTVVGHRYYLTLQYGLCVGPIDRVIGVEWDGLQPEVCSRINWTTYDQIFYRQWNLFGGDRQEGGIYVEIRAYRGRPDQRPDSHLVQKVGTAMPAYPHLAYLVVRGNPFPHSDDDPCVLVLNLPGWTCPCPDHDFDMCIGERAAYMGTSPLLHPLAVEVQRVDACNPLALTGGAHDIDGDANPANMLYEILHDEVWGLGIADERGIDRASFVAAGQTLAAEQLGLSMVLDGAREAKEVIEEILRHIDGVLALNPDTGLLELRLIRGDYVVDDLPEFGPNEIRSLTFSRPALDTLSNSARATFPNRSERYKACVVTAQDLAGIQQRGAEVVEDVSYPAVTNAALAQRLAARDLKVVSYPWARVTFSVDRSAWNLRQGSAFRLTWPDLGISSMVCRVSRIAPGDLLKSEITVDAIEDVFGVSWTAYGPIPQSGWEDPFQSE